MSSVNSVSTSSSMCLCSASDYEAVEIARRLRAYGIEPTGDKQANKLKLHEIELLKVKSNNEPTGKFLTISYAQEKEIIDKKKENLYGSLKNYKKEKGNKDTLKEDEILGRQILAIIELKQREEKDKENSKKLKTDKPEKIKKEKIRQVKINSDTEKALPLMPELKANTNIQQINIKTES